MILSETKTKQILKDNLVMICDTREQNRHIALKFQGKNKRERVVYRKLEFGDYSFEILPNEITGDETISFENIFAIERKSGDIAKGGGYAELRNNLTTKHEPFKKEFQRAANSGCNFFYLLIENTIDEDCIKFVPEPNKNNYDKKIISSEHFESIYKGFLINRNNERILLGMKPIEVINCMAEKSCLIIMNKFYEVFVQLLKYKK